MEDGSYIKDAQQSLNAILTKSAPRSADHGQQVSVAEARERPILNPTTNRTKTRVLFVTTDTSILTQTTKTLDGYVAVASMFDEVHIMVLRTGIPPKFPVLRVDSTTWLYTVSERKFIDMPFRAWRMMHEQLEFASGFRPDIIVAREPGVSALVAYGAGVYYDRPTQLHIPSGFSQPSGFFKRLWQRFLISRFGSIRVTTEAEVSLYSDAHDEKDIAVLPRYRDYTVQFTGEQGAYLRQKYPQFNFIILYIGELTTSTTAFQAIDAVRQVLRNPRVGFVMVGNGTGVMECERRATLLGIKDQVIIERRADSIQEYLKSADVLLVTDKDTMADEITLYGAAAGVPMVMTTTALRQDMFTDGKSAYVVDDARSLRLPELLSRLLNNGTERLLLRQTVRQLAESRLYVNPEEYANSYRASIEKAFVQVTE